MEEKYIFRTKVEKEYTTIRNSLIKDKAISWGSRGLLIYLLSKTETWIVRKADLVSGSPASNHVIAKLLKELEVAGYIKRTRIRNKKGQWEWHTWVYDKPQSVPVGASIPHKSDVDKNQVRLSMNGEPIHGKPGYIVSTELKKTDQTNNGIKKIYIQKIGKLTPSKIKRFQNWETLYSDKWILEAMDLAVKYNKKSFGYIQAILENWKENGRNGAKLTPENVDYLSDEFAEFIEE